ncbi:MAG: Ig-like domain-containing protein [Lachnospiraceae bacterium]|nr:Ig-like domain-containing protein [Lachnospiraceae bacterium]
MDTMVIRQLIIPATAVLEANTFTYAQKVESVKFVGTQSEWDSFKLQFNKETILDSEAIQYDYRVDLSSCTINDIDVQTYTGDALTPKITVKASLTGRALIENKDYTVQYSDNVNMGTAKVVATGKNDQVGSKSRFKGSTTVNYAITKDGEPPVDKTDLNKAIEEAEAYYNTIKDNDDFKEQATALSNAIEAAKKLAEAKKEAQAAMNEQVTISRKGNKYTVKWKKVLSADGYRVYVQYYGEKKSKTVSTIKKNTTTKMTIAKIGGKKISNKKIFTVYVAPFKIINGKNVELGKSTVAYVVGINNNKYTNVKKLTLTKNKCSLKVGKTANIKVKVTLDAKNKKHIPKKYALKFRYKSSDTGIATVNKNGKIKGIKKGKCTIFFCCLSNAYSSNNLDTNPYSTIFNYTFVQKTV